MRAFRTGESVILVAAVVAIAALLALRSRERAAPQRAGSRAEPLPPAREPSPDAQAEDVPALAVVTGTVSGKYGPIVAVRVLARVGGEVVAEAMTDPSGRYRIEVAAGIDTDIEARPVPETELAPARRIVLPLAGEELKVDFELAKGGSARGTFAGDRWLCFDVVAIRVEDYPLGPEPLPIGALEAAPKVSGCVTGMQFGDEKSMHRWSPSTEATTAFEFRGLDPAATYRLALLDRYWALDSPVLFRAGDEKITARAVPVFRVFVEARDIETRDLVPKFRVTLGNRAGTVLGTFEGEGGRVSCCVPRPERVTRGKPWSKSDLDENEWELVVAADGYLEERLSAEGVHRVSLQRVRAPNVTLRIAYEDGLPVDSEVQARFESIDDPDGLIHVDLRKDGPGRWRAALPPGKWRIYLSRPKAFHDVRRIVEVSVPADGSVEAVQRYVRGGTVTFERRVALAREIDGERQEILAYEGTWEDVPLGTYVLIRGDKEVGKLDVGVGTSQVVPKGPEPELGD